jgi:hypothetical protein
MLVRIFMITASNAVELEEEINRGLEYRAKTAMDVISITLQDTVHQDGRSDKSLYFIFYRG